MDPVCIREVTHAYPAYRALYLICARYIDEEFLKAECDAPESMRLGLAEMLQPLRAACVGAIQAAISNRAKHFISRGATSVQWDIKQEVAAFTCNPYMEALCKYMNDEVNHNMHLLNRSKLEECVNEQVGKLRGQFER